MDYENAVTFKGDPAEGWAWIEAKFKPDGFKIEKIRSNEWELIGPGALGPSSVKSGKNPLRFISRAVVRITDDRIKMEAEFGTLRFVQKILLYAVPAIDFAMALGIFIATREGLIPAIIALTLVPWFFIASYLNRNMERETIEALNAVLEGVSGGTFQRTV